MPYDTSVLIKIRDAIKADANNRGYANKTPGAVAILFSEQFPTGAKSDSNITLSPTIAYLIGKLKWGGIVDAAADKGNTAHDSAIMLVNAQPQNVTELDSGMATIKTLVNDFLNAGLIDQADTDYIFSSAQVDVMHISDAQALGLDKVEQGDVEAALAIK